MILLLAVLLIQHVQPPAAMARERQPIRVLFTDEELADTLARCDTAEEVLDALYSASWHRHANLE